MRDFPYRTAPEFSAFKKLRTPRQVQDFLDAIPINFEQEGQTYHSPLVTLQRRRAHCMEGAMLAAAIFWYHGRKPLLLDLKTTPSDDDHVVALFQEHGLWGAVSKTNHPVLRYRDPIYRTVRELVLSYFNEYFLDDGKKTLRQFSRPFSMLGFEDDWIVSADNLWNVAVLLDESTHYDIAPKKTLKLLRPADALEIKATKATQWQRKTKRTS